MAMWSALAVAAVTRLEIVDILIASAPHASVACARAADAEATALTRLLHTLVSLRSLVQPHPQTYGLSIRFYRREHAISGNKVWHLCSWWLYSYPTSTTHNGGRANARDRPRSMRDSGD